MAKATSPCAAAQNVEVASITQALFAFNVLSSYVELGRGRIYGLIADPTLKFPAPIKIGKSSRWIKAEIDQWIATQAAQRGTAQGVM